MKLLQFNDCFRAIWSALYDPQQCSWKSSNWEGLSGRVSVDFQRQPAFTMGHESACEGETRGTPSGLDACTVGRQQACTTFTRTLPTRGRRYTPTRFPREDLCMHVCVYTRARTHTHTPSCTLKLRKIIVHREGGEEGDECQAAVA